MTTDDAARVLRHLRATPSLPMPINRIAWDLGLTRRAVEAAIQALRLARQPVIDDGDGVRLARSANELAAYRIAFDERLRSMWRTRRALRDAERQMRRDEAGAAQPSLWGAA